MRNGFLPKVALKGMRLGQDEAPAPSSGDNFHGFGGRFVSRMPFFPVFGPSLPFYWNQPYPTPAPPVQPRYICVKEEDEEGEEKFVCEPEQRPQYGPPPFVAPFNPFLRRQPIFYTRPYAGSFFF